MDQVLVIEFEEERVDDGDWEGGEDEIEGDSQQHHRGGGGPLRVALQRVRLHPRHAAQLGDDEDVQRQHRQRHQQERQDFDAEVPEQHQAGGSAGADLRTRATVHGLLVGVVGAGAGVVVQRSGVHGVEVALHGAQAYGQHNQDGDDDLGTPDRAVLLAPKRMADGDVPLGGEAQHQKRPEVLGGHEHDREHLAHHRGVEQVYLPRHVQLEHHVKRQEDKVVEGQCRQVTARRMPHALLNPDDEGEDVTRETHQVDERSNVAVDGYVLGVVHGVVLFGGVRGRHCLSLVEGGSCCCDVGVRHVLEGRDIGSGDEQQPQHTQDEVHDFGDCKHLKIKKKYLKG